MKKSDKALLLFKANEVIRWLSADEVTWWKFKTFGIPDGCLTVDDMEEFTDTETYNEMVECFINLMFEEIKRNYDYGK